MNRKRLRQAVILITAVICVFYLLYRGLFTLNLNSPYAVFASLFLYAAEIYGVCVVLLFFLQVWDTTEPPQQPVLEGRTVDVFVPTYNEDPDLLRTTLSACVRMNYPHRTFLCDDGGTEARCNDPEKGPPSRERAAKLKAICEELGVIYITRPDNRHAKAGNVNFAFERTDGEFIVILDADHVPEPHFITRLIGYFADEKLAFVQTPHAFYNFESFQSCHDHKTNTYWEDGQLFYKVIQPGRNRWNAPIFAGSAAMFRRKALAEVGYIATETITEDMHTGLRMHAKGWKSLGVSERLVAGQAAPDVTTFHTQRLRWGEGNLSIMAHNNPLTTPGLSLGQRLCYLGSMIHWAGGLFKVAIYFTPLMMLITGVPPVNQFTWALFGIMSVYIFASVFGVRYISNGQGSFWRNELFTMIGFWTQIRGTMRAILWRKLSQFVVTSKRGRQTNSVWPFVRPHFYFVALSVLALFWGWGKVMFGLSADYWKPVLATCWTLFHLSLAVTCIRRSLWPEDKRYSYRHAVHLPVEYGVSDEDMFVRDALGITADLSENGIGLIAYREIEVGTVINLRVHGTGECLDVRAKVVRCQPLSRTVGGMNESGGFRIGAQFLNLSPEQFDILNRIVMHYAVPRLYEQYRKKEPGFWARFVSRLRHGLILRRHADRVPYRLPFIMAYGPDDNPTFASTEDVSREAMVTLLPERLLPSSQCIFRMWTPAGEIEGQVEVLRADPHVYAAKKYYRTVLGFVRFEEQGRVAFEDLLLPPGRRRHGAALVPMKKRLTVPMTKRTVLAAAALLPFLLVLTLTFRYMYRDDIFLRDLVASNGQIVPDDYERLERVYAATLQDSNPSTDRLILLMNALGKVGRDADADRVVGLLAPRDSKNLDLQIANANAFLHSKDYSRAKAEYERLFRDFKTGKLPPERQREMRLTLARATFHAGDVPGASRLFAELIAESPGDAALRYEFAGALVGARHYAEAAGVYNGVEPDRNGRLLLATIFSLLNRPDDAERQCDLVLRESPDDAEAQLVKADVLAGKNNTVRAEAIYNRLRKINPGDPAVRSRLAFIAMKGKDYDQALALFQQLIDEGATGTAEFKGFVDAASGASALSEAHREMAKRIAGTAATDWANDAVYLARLGWVLQRTREFAASVEILSLAMELDGNNPDLVRQYVAALFDAGQRTKALPFLEKAERTADNRSMLATIYLEQKKYELAETECRAVLADKPDNLGARQQLAAALTGLSRHNEAVTLLRALIAELPNDPDLPIRLAEALLAKGDYISAISRYVALLGGNFEQPNCWEGFINASAALRRLPPGQTPLLRKIAARALKGDISKPEILSRLAFVLLENGEEKQAPTLLDRAIELRPKDPAVRDEIAGVLSFAGRHRDALRMMEGLPPDKLDPYRLISCYAALREWNRAERLCWDILARNPKERKAMRWLADVLSWQGDHAGALDWFAKLLQETPDDSDLLLRVAEVTLWRGESAAALDKFKVLFNRNVEEPRIWEGLLAAAGAVKSLTPEQSQLVRRIHERFLVEDAVTEKLRTNPLFLTRLASGLQRAGSVKEADAMFAQVVKLAPASAEGRKNLATALAAARKYAEAVRLYDGLDLDADDRFRLIDLCCAAGDFAQAQERCEVILKAEPNNRRAKRWLADALSWKKDYANALRNFRELIRDEPRDIDLKIREAEVTLWSNDHAQALLLYQALPLKTWDAPRVRRGYVDSLAGAKGAPIAAESERLLAIAERSVLANDALGGDAVFLARLGGLLARAGEKAAASRLLEKAVALAPSEPAARLELGGALQAADRPADALRIYEGLTLQGDERFRRVEALAALRRFDQAIEECRTIWRLDADDKAAKLWLGNLLAWKGQHGESIRLLTELARDWTDNPEVPLCLAEATLWSGEPAKAAVLFMKLPDKTLESARARRGLIDAAAAQPLKLDAKRLTTIANRVLDNKDELHADVVLLARLALVLRRSGAIPAANRILDHALTLKPKEPAERLELGGALANAGRFAEAGRMYQGLKLDGENRFRNIELLAAQRDWAGARAAIEAMLTANPTDLLAKRKLAEVLSWKGDYPEALRLFDEIVRDRPDDEESLICRAQVNLWSRNYPKALALFLALAPQARERVDVRRGLVDAAAGSEPTAVSAKDRPVFRRVAELSLAEGDPIRTESLSLARLGLTLHRVGDAEFAAKAFARAFEIVPPEEPALFEIAGTLIAAGEFDKASKLYDGLKLEGANRYRRLELFAAQKHWPAALIECRRLLTVDANDRRAQRWQADVLSWKGDYPEAIQAFEALSKAEPDDGELRIRLAEVLLWAREHDKALALLEILPESALQRPDLRRGFIDAAGANDKPFREQTILLARRVARITLQAPANDDLKTNVPYLARLAWVLIKSSEREAADKLLTLAVERKPTAAAERKELGGVLGAGGRVPEALKMYEGLKLEREDRFRLIGLHSAVKDFERAETLCRDVLRDDADNRLGKRWLADVLSWKGAFEDSLKLFSELIRLEPGNVELPIRVAEVTLWSQDAERALVLFQGMLEKSFDQPRLWEGFVSAAAAVKTISPAQLKLAKRIRQSADKLDLRSAMFWSRLAWVIYRDGDEADAKALLDRALALKPSEAIERCELAGVLAASKRFKEAAELYVGIDLKPDDHLRLAEIGAAASDFTGAIEHLEAVLSDDPKNKIALRQMADVRSWNKEYAAALDIYSGLLRDDPKNPEFLLRIAEIRHWSGASAEAMKSFEEMIAAGSNDPRVWRGFVESAAAARRLTAEQGLTAKRIADEIGTNIKMKELDADPIFLARLVLVLHRGAQHPSRDKLVPRIAKETPASPAARRELAGILMAVGANAEARKLYSGVPLEPEDRMRLIDLSTAEKQFAEAEKQARDLLAANPDDPKIKRKLASVLVANAKPAEALSLLASVQKEFANDETFAVELALTTLWSGDSETALKLLEPLLAKGDDLTIITSYLDAAAMVKKLDPAIHKKMVKGIYDQTVKLKLSNAKLRQIAWIMRKLGDVDSAVAILQKLLAANPSDRDMRLELAQTLDDSGQADEAAKHYRILLASPSPQ